MRNVMRSATAALVAACGLVQIAHGGQVGWIATIDGQPYRAGQFTVSSQAPFTPIDIDLDVVSGNDLNLHIFDVLTNDVIDSVGLVTVVLSSSNPSMAICVLVAGEVDGNFDVAFDSARRDRVEGLRNFGGLRFLPDPTLPQNLPKKTVVSVNVLGDITTEEMLGNSRTDDRAALHCQTPAPEVSGWLSSS
jgi:hypothetical protein